MLNFTNNNVHPPIEKFCLKWTRHSVMMQHALGSLADAWQQDHHQQVNNLASHAAAEQLLGNRSELTINRVVPPSSQVNQQLQSPGSCQLADTTLYLADGSRVRTHFLVLAAGSSFFRNQGFSSDIIFGSGEREDVLSVLQFLYTGVVNIQMNKLGDILDLARALSIDSLVATIEDIIDDVEKYSETSEITTTETDATFPPQQHQPQSQTFLSSYEQHLQQQQQTCTSSTPQNTHHQATTPTQSLLSTALQQQPSSSPGTVTTSTQSVFRGPLNLSHQPVIRSVASINNHSLKQQQHQQPTITNHNPSGTVGDAVSAMIYNAMTNKSQKTSPDILKRLNELEPCDLTTINSSTQQQQQQQQTAATAPKIIVPNHCYKPVLSPRNQLVAKSSQAKILMPRKSEGSISSDIKSPSPPSNLCQRRRPSIETIDDEESGAPRPKQIRISQTLLESVLLRNVSPQNNVNIANNYGEDEDNINVDVDSEMSGSMKQDSQIRLALESKERMILDSKERQLFGAQILPLLGAAVMPAGAGGGSSNLSSLLSAAVKLKQVADIVLQKGEDRKLAFHEPRPCPTCKRMYRDAATLRTHTSIMHTKGRQPYRCSCGTDFETKYGMYQHKKSGHPAVSGSEASHPALTGIQINNLVQVDPTDPADPGRNPAETSRNPVDSGRNSSDPCLNLANTSHNTSEPGYHLQQQDDDLEECDLVIATSPPPPNGMEEGESINVDGSGNNQLPVPMVKT